MTTEEFVKGAMSAGMSERLARFLASSLALEGHTHSSEDIVIDDDGETLDVFVDQVSETLADEEEEEPGAELEDEEEDEAVPEG